MSSGLFHFALISSSRTLYTWGKNLEHQLGTEDKERRAVNKPSPIDNIENPMFVDCGADFTLVMSTDYVVRAFGGNSNGQVHVLIQLIFITPHFHIVTSIVLDISLPSLKILIVRKCRGIKLGKRKRQSISNTVINGYLNLN